MRFPLITFRWKPTKEQILAAAGKTVPDVIGHDLHHKYDSHQSRLRCFTPANHLHNG